MVDMNPLSQKLDPEFRKSLGIGSFQVAVMTWRLGDAEQNLEHRPHALHNARDIAIGRRAPNRLDEPLPVIAHAIKHPWCGEPLRHAASTSFLLPSRRPLVCGPRKNLPPL